MNFQTSNTLQTAWSSKEVFVIRDLISNYESIWQPTEDEKRRETAVRRVLMRVLSNSAPTAPKAAGDLKAWVYVNDRSTCYQVAVSITLKTIILNTPLCSRFHY